MPAPQSQFVSPFIAGLQQLVNCTEGYASLQAIYDAEEKIILRDLANAADDRALTIVQGRYKMLKHLRNLPEETVDRYINSKQAGTK